MKYSKVVYGLGCLMILPVYMFQNRAKPGDAQAVVSSLTLADCSKETGTAKTVCFAGNFKATLNADETALLQRDYAKKDAVRWSNFPQAFSHPDRVGLSLGSLTPEQLTAFKALMEAALAQNIPNEGYNELEGVRVADDYLGKGTGQTATFGSGNYYVAFLGQPSTTGLWELQYGGHHFAFSNTYNKGDIIGATPSFRGVEPMKLLTANGKTYQPLEQERGAFESVIKSLTEAQKTNAKLSSTFNDVVLGPGQDGNFPLKKSGIKVADLNIAQQKQVIAAIELYVDDLDPATAKTIMKKYTAELPDTYISYSGSGTMNETSDYIRIDGPGIWIEYAVQPSRDFPGTTHPHSIWRDHKTDYGGN